jgi:hypothetical protein
MQPNIFLSDVLYPVWIESCRSILFPRGNYIKIEVTR